MKPTRFIIIDDDEIDIKVCRIYIKNVLPDIEIVYFTTPEEGLTYIETAFNNDIPVLSVLFLDINMPTLSAWEFLEKYDGFSEKIKNQIIIYLLSSSVDPRDKDKAASNKYIKGYLEKPITKGAIQKLYEEHI